MNDAQRIDPKGNIFAAALEVERLAIDIARKQMANDILRNLLAHSALPPLDRIAMVIALCDAEARK